MRLRSFFYILPSNRVLVACGAWFISEMRLLVKRAYIELERFNGLRRYNHGFPVEIVGSRGY